jgi:cytochrome P450
MTSTAPAGSLESQGRSVAHDVGADVVSAGPHSCPGQGFATMSAVLTAAMLAQRVRFDPVPDYRPEPSFSLKLRPRNGIQLTMRPREGLGS